MSLYYSKLMLMCEFTRCNVPICVYVATKHGCHAIAGKSKILKCLDHFDSKTQRQGLLKGFCLHIKKNQPKSPVEMWHLIYDYLFVKLTSQFKLRQVFE